MKKPSERRIDKPNVSAKSRDAKKAAGVVYTSCEPTCSLAGGRLPHWLDSRVTSISSRGGWKSWK